MGETPHPTHEVFISYANADKQWAFAACAVLEARGIRCWIAPRDISPGTEWGAAIISGIDVCSIMVLIFSGHANESPQVRREVERAVNKGLIVLPCRVEDVMPVGAMEFALSNTHWLDAFTPPVERQMNRLGESVQALLTRDRSAAKPPLARKPSRSRSSNNGPKSVRPTKTNEVERLEKARQLVRNPAIAMIAVGCLGLAASLLVFTFRGMRVTDQIALIILSSTVAGTAIVAAISMLSLRWYRLCLLGSIAVMPAGGFLCLLGIPVGVWALQTLRVPGMRATFEWNKERLQKSLSITDAE